MAQHQRKNAGEQVVTANRLIDGVVVYWSLSGWVERLPQAAIFSLDEAKTTQAKAQGVSIVDIYFFEVRREGKTIIPASERERIRANGPTVRLDLGKQAEQV